MRADAALNPTDLGCGRPAMADILNGDPDTIDPYGPDPLGDPQDPPG